MYTFCLMKKHNPSWILPWELRCLPIPFDRQARLKPQQCHPEHCWHCAHNCTAPHTTRFSSSGVYRAQPHNWHWPTNDKCLTVTSSKDSQVSDNAVCTRLSSWGTTNSRQCGWAIQNEFCRICQEQSHLRVIGHSTHKKNLWRKIISLDKEKPNQSIKTPL